MSIERVCTFCGSRTGENPRFRELTKDLGKQLADNQLELVYGGGKIGLMNVVANAVLTYGGQAHGVIPGHLEHQAHQNLTALHVTNTMHERKAMMAELSDAFIALPGGFGTFEELLETITWVQLELHDKPVIIFNMDGYYDLLIDFVDNAVDQNFIDAESRDEIHVVSTVEECMELLTQ